MTRLRREVVVELEAATLFSPLRDGAPKVMFCGDLLTQVEIGVAETPEHGPVAYVAWQRRAGRPGPGRILVGPDSDDPVVLALTRELGGRTLTVGADLDPPRETRELCARIVEWGATFAVVASRRPTPKLLIMASVRPPRGVAMRMTMGGVTFVSPAELQEQNIEPARLLDFEGVCFAEHVRAAQNLAEVEDLCQGAPAEDLFDDSELFTFQPFRSLYCPVADEGLAVFVPRVTIDEDGRMVDLDFAIFEATVLHCGPMRLRSGEVVGAVCANGRDGRGGIFTTREGGPPVFLAAGWGIALPTAPLHDEATTADLIAARVEAQRAKIAAAGELRELRVRDGRVEIAVYQSGTTTPDRIDDTGSPRADDDPEGRQWWAEARGEAGPS